MNVDENADEQNSSLAIEDSLPPFRHGVARTVRA